MNQTPVKISLHQPHLTYVTLHFLDVSMSFIFRSDVDWIINQLLVIIPIFSVVFLYCLNTYMIAQKLVNNCLHHHRT